jgi:hypothetical protein
MNGNMLLYIFYNRKNNKSPKPIRDEAAAKVFARKNPKMKVDIYDERTVLIDSGVAGDIFNKERERK